MPERLIHASWYRDHANWFIATAGVVIILAATLAGVLRVYQTAENAHKAICALRQERIQGVVAAKKFLDEHPQGIPGISRADILRSIATQSETVRAFRFADC